MELPGTLVSSASMRLPQFEAPEVSHGDRLAFGYTHCKLRAEAFERLAGVRAEVEYVGFPVSPDLWKWHSCCGVFGVKASEFRYRKPLICQYPRCDSKVCGRHEVADVETWASKVSPTVWLLFPKVERQQTLWRQSKWPRNTKSDA